MWIIPKNLHTSAFVQDTEALISDYQELSELSAQSLLARSKPSPARTWLRRWKRDGSMPHLYGRILRPSLGSDFAGKWTSSLEASLVSHLVPQDSEQETMTQDTFGLSSSEESESWHTLPLFSSRMLRGSSQANSRAMDGPILSERQFCSMSSASWKDWVTKQRQAYSQRVKSERPTNENECSLWVCAPISATQDALLFQRCSAPQSEEMWATPKAAACGMTARTTGRPIEKSTHLTTQVHLASQPTTRPTPKAAQPTQPQEALSNMSGSPQGSQRATPNSRDYKGPQTKDGSRLARGYGDQLPDHVALAWATPYTGTKDHQGGSLEHYQNRLAKGRQIDLHGQITLTDKAYTGKLNPRWVETLMGLPVGWTMPSCADPWTIEQMNCDCSEMGLFPPQQSEPSESCGES